MYADDAAPDTATVIKDYLHMPSVLLMNSSKPNRYVNPVTAYVGRICSASHCDRHAPCSQAECLADKLINAEWLQ